MSPPDVDDFALTSPLGILLAHTLGIDSATGFAVLHGVLLAFALGGGVALMQSQVSDRSARLFVVAWFCSPLCGVLLWWLGTPDPFTFLAATAAVVGPPVAVLAAAMLLGFNHFEQGVFILTAALIIRFRWRGRPSLAAVASTIGAFVAGRVLLQVFLAAAGATGGRTSYVTERGVWFFVERWADQIPAMTFAMFGVLWLPLIVMARELRAGWTLAALAVIATVPVLITRDVTRVFSLLSWPVVVFGCIWWSTQEHRQVERFVPWLLVAAVVVPRIVLWDGRVYVL